MDLSKISEDYFQELCNDQNWNCKKITECENRTPDFEVKTTKGSFIAEISYAQYEFEFGKAISVKTGEKVRKKIDQKRKRKQLRDYNKPTILVLTGASWELGFESMKAAMYGDLMLEVGVNSGKIINSYHDKNAFFQKNRNTSIGALAYLNRTLTAKEQAFEQTPKTMPHITIYHNIYAKHPFTHDFFDNNHQLHQYWFKLENTGIKNE